MICLRCTWVLEILDVTAWKDYMVMLLAADSLLVASTTWEFVMRCDMLLGDE